MSVVTKTILKGHSDEVLCVESPNFASSHCLLSGSFDGTARLWDIRENGGFECCNCFCVPGKTPVNFLFHFLFKLTYNRSIR